MPVKKIEPMCVVTIDYIELLMPAAIGMKVVEHLTKAVKCRSTGYAPIKVRIEEQPEVKLEMVKPQHVEAPDHSPAPRGARQLENDPSQTVRALLSR